MKAIKKIGQCFLIVTIILICLFLYFDSDYHELRRLNSQIEKDLNIKLSELPTLVDRKSYGWAEEGGSKAVLKLARKDCITIALKINEFEGASDKSEYFNMFDKSSSPSQKKWFKFNEHGDYTSYALNETTCNLYRVYHYE